MKKYYKITTKHLEKHFKKIEDYCASLDTPIKIKGVKQIINFNNTEFVYEVLKGMINIGTNNCIPDCNRSLWDIYACCKYYNPEITVKNVYDAIIELSETKRILNLFCGNIGKRVFTTNLLKYSGYSSPFNIEDEITTWHSGYFDEFGIAWNKENV